MNYRKRFKEQASQVLDKKTPDLNFEGKLMFSKKNTGTPKPKLKWAIYVPVFTSVAALGIILGVALWPKSYDAMNPPDYYVNVPAQRMGADDESSLRNDIGSIDVYNNFVSSVSPLVFNGEFDARSFSPVDAFVNVAILAYVSTGVSQEEILTALDVDSIIELNQVTKDVIDVLGSGAGYTLNSFWFDDDLYDLTDNSENLLEVLSNYYYTNIIARRPTTELVNEWLDIYVPKDRFPVIPEVELKDGGVEAAIVSSYFAKDTWSDEKLSKQFEDEYKTHNHKMTFNGRDESKEIDYLKVGARKLVADNYIGASLFLQEMKVNFFLPNVDTSINGIFSDALANNHLDDDAVGIQAPYFKIDNRLDLIPAYRTLGLNSVFDVAAAQGLIDIPLGENPLVVTSIEQFSTMSFDFGGLYSASVTVTQMEPTSGGDFFDIEVIVFDRPFVFTVTYHDATILVGQVYNPNY